MNLADQIRVRSRVNIDGLTGEEVWQEGDWQDDNRDGDVGNGEVREEVVRDGPQLTVSVDRWDREAVVDQGKEKDDKVRDREDGQHHRRLLQQRRATHD